MQQWIKNSNYDDQKKFHYDFKLPQLEILAVIFSKNMKCDSQTNQLTKEKNLLSMLRKLSKFKFIKAVL